MTARTWRGYWWLPAAPQTRVPGHLVVEPDGRCSLQLTGNLDLSLATPDGGSAASPLDARAPAIHGEANGAAITLLDCVTLRREGFPGTSSVQDLHVQQALVGTHCGANEPVFRAAILTLENLTSWLSPDDAIDRTHDSHTEAARVAKSDATACEVAGWTITARSTVQPFQVIQERQSHRVANEIEAHLVLEPSEPVALEEFNSWVLELMDLITLATGEACGQIGLTLIHKETLRRRDAHGSPYEWEIRVEVFGARIHTAAPFADATADWRFRFTCKDLEFAQAVPAWHALRAKTAEACNVFFGLEYARPRFGEVRLLLVAITAEALHAALYGKEAELPREQFKRIRTRALEAQQTDEDRAWVSQKLRNGVSFRKRLLSLAAKPERSAVSLVVEDIPAWARDVTTARNNLAHSGNEAAERNLLRLEWETSSVITLVLMAELGVAAETQVRAAESVLQVPAALRA